MTSGGVGSRFRHVEACMGTVFSFDVADTPAPAVLAAVVARLHQIDAVFSTYRPDSAISRLGRGEVSLADCPADVAVVLGLCADAQQRTGGWFSAQAGGRLDPSGLVKGWAVEQASRLLRAAGHQAHSINGGGDIQSAGGPWRFAVADPADPRRLRAVLHGHDLAVATSGGAERGAHILDPFTRRPAAGVAGVTVVGPSLTEADAYATAGFAMGVRAPDWLATLEGYDALVIGTGGDCWQTPGLPLAAP